MQVVKKVIPNKPNLQLKGMIYLSMCDLLLPPVIKVHVVYFLVTLTKKDS